MKMPENEKLHIFCTNQAILRIFTTFNFIGSLRGVVHIKSFH